MMSPATGSSSHELLLIVKNAATILLRVKQWGLLYFIHQGPQKLNNTLSLQLSQA